MIEKSILEQIKEHALFIDWNVAFKGKAYNNQHLFRVVTIADFLAEKEGAERDICAAGAWLHDIGLMDGNDDNPVAIRKIAEDYLAGLGLRDETSSRIAACVETHEGLSRAVSLEARIVHDADVLDKMGLLGIIRHIWKITNLIDRNANIAEVFLLLQKHLRKRRENLYTATARKLVPVLDEAQHQFFAHRDQALESIQLIMQSAKKGVISDEIARNMLVKGDHPTLELQLMISREILQWWYEKGECRV